MKVIALSFLTVLTALAASNARLLYGPHEVRVSGTIRQQTFPGRPNYEDIAKGDEPETYWIIDLSAATDVIATQDDDLNSTERGVRSMQLVFDGTLSKKSYTDFPGFVGQRVTVSGQLFHAHTGHHKTAVLISVRGMEKALTARANP